MATIQAVHRACVDAANECPQYSRRYDQFSPGVGTERATTLKFWLQEDLLWNKGYHVFLPSWAVEEFDKVDPLRARYRSVTIVI